MSAHWQRYKRWMAHPFLLANWCVQLGTVLAYWKLQGFTEALGRAISGALTIVVLVYIAAVLTTLWIRAATATLTHFGADS